MYFLQESINANAKHLFMFVSFKKVNNERSLEKNKKNEGSKVPTLFSFYNSLLTQDEKSIKALAECKQSTIFVESKLAEWNDSLERWENFNVEVRNSEIIEFCQPRVLQDYLIWAEELTYKQIFDYCRRMGGTLPSISYEKPLTAGK